MNKDRRSTVKKSTFALIIFALLIALIGGTYARYSSTATGSGPVNIAKWAVEVNGTDISTATTTFNLTFTEESSDTVDNKIAPGVTATAYVDVDLTGTEVSVDFDCALDEATANSNLESVFGTGYASKINLSVGTPEIQGTNTNMTLSGKTVTITDKSTAMSGTVRVPITLTWTNNDANNTADTATGVGKTSVEIPVKLTVNQHITTTP